MKIIFLLLGVCYSVNSLSQVKGIISNAKNREPMEGVNIRLVSSGQIYSTDKTGHFFIHQTNTIDTLKIVMVGYRSIIIPILKNQKLSVELEQAVNEIEEVLVQTGYQRIPKERATGAFSYIDNKTFNRIQTPDIWSRLEGISSSLNFEYPGTVRSLNSKPDVRIRGWGTIHGETKPLIVLDNFPYEGELESINPNDIDNITFLKDAAAASIWGARAGNGVIVINTKRGVINQKPRLLIHSSLTVENTPDLFYSRKFLAPSDLIELEKILFEAGRYTKNNWTAVSPVVDILFHLADNKITSTMANERIEALKQNDIRKEAQKYLYRPAVSTQQSVSVSGGSEKQQYYVSAGWDKLNSSLVNESRDRLTMTLSENINFSKMFNFSFQLNSVFHKNKNNGVAMPDLRPTGLDEIYTYATLADIHGNALPIVKNNRFAYTDDALNQGLQDWHYRPLDELNLNDKTDQNSNLRAVSHIGFKPVSFLNFEARYQFQLDQGGRREYYAPESYMVRHEVNRFTQMDGNSPIPDGGILNTSNSKFKTHYGRLQANVDYSFRNNHAINAIVGAEIRQEQKQMLGANKLYGYDNDILVFHSMLDYNQVYPTRPMSSARIVNGSSAGTMYVDRFVSYYGNFSYGYKHRYYLSGSLRWDASNIFGVDFNQKGVPLWSLGAAWNMHHESFMKFDWLNNLKWRFTIGANGNTVRTVSSLPYIAYSNSSINGKPMGRLQSVGNPDLKWEKVNTINIGADFGIWSNRISGSLDWYQKEGSNLIGKDMLDPTTGIFNLGLNYNLDNRRNYANVVTKGFDIELKTININKTLRWETNWLFSKISNEVTRYYTPFSSKGLDFFGSISAVPIVVGDAVNQVYAIPWIGLDETNGSPLIMLDNKLSTDYNSYFSNLELQDALRVGVSSPPYFGSIRNHVEWKGFSMGANLIYKFGHVFRRPSISYSSLFGTNKITHVDYLERWQKAGDEKNTTIPSMPSTTNVRRDQAYLYSEALITKGDLIRLQDVTFSYSFDRRYLQPLRIENAQLYLNLRNLGVLWKSNNVGIDPDAGGLYPIPFQLIIGTKINL